MVRIGHVSFWNKLFVYIFGFPLQNVSERTAETWSNYKEVHNNNKAAQNNYKGLKELQIEAKHP